MPRTRGGPGFGAFVISLDFELHWGVRDLTPVDGAYAENLRGARAAVPRILALFEEYEIAATWATVGLLFASTRAEQLAYAPTERPTYAEPGLDPYDEQVGDNERTDPVHFGASLVDAICATPRQEVASHTFSHFYCLEPGQTETQFGADLDSARAIAEAHDVALRSLVFPRNQVNRDYRGILADRGFTCFREGQRGWCYQAGTRALPYRAGRWIDTYVPVTTQLTTSWTEIAAGPPPIAVPANRFLRPTTPAVRRLDPLKLRRIGRALEEAATEQRVFHLWWHPHNFGRYPDANLAVLRRVLDRYRELADRYGLASLSMQGAAEASLAAPQ